MDFLEAFRNGTVVHCDDVYQRRDLLMFLRDNGFDMSDTILRNIYDPSSGSRYLWVATFGKGNNSVSCWCGTTSFSDREIISFDEYLNRTSSALSVSADEIFDLF